MIKIPTSLVTSIGAYALFEPIVVESAEVGEPLSQLNLGAGFGSEHANLYRVTHQLFTLAFSMQSGVAGPRHRKEEIPGEFLSGIFGIVKGWDADAPSARMPKELPPPPPPFTAATAIVLGEKLDGGARRGAVICGPDAITPAADGRWLVYGGNVMPDEIIPASGSIVPAAQRMFHNQGLPMRTIPGAGEAAEIWQSQCGFRPEFASFTAETMRWTVPEDGTGLALPVYDGGAFRLVFPDPEKCESSGAPEPDGKPLEFDCYSGDDVAEDLPGLLPYSKTGF
ncbi:MAG: hypothetical protein ACYS8W_10330 [Planctomycetota bacterium]|jgi:hypothetical protein